MQFSSYLSPFASFFVNFFFVAQHTKKSYQSYQNKFITSSFLFSFSYLIRSLRVFIFFLSSTFFSQVGGFVFLVVLWVLYPFFQTLLDLGLPIVCYLFDPKVLPEYFIVSYSIYINYLFIFILIINFIFKDVSF